MKTRTSSAWIALSCLAMTLGCNAFPSVAETDGSFEDSVRTYAKLVRWGDFDRASEFVDADQRPDFVALSPDLERLRFTDFDVGPVRYGEDGAWAKVKVVYHVYDVSTLVEQRIIDEQVWMKESRTVWSVHSNLPGFRNALGLPPTASAYNEPNG